MCTSSFSVSSVNSRGASVCSTITPSVSLERDRIGTATIDWKRSSCSSGMYFMRGSFIARSRMNSGVRLRATHPVRPSSIASCTLPDRVGEHLRGGADRQLVVFEQVDEAGVAVGRLRRQIDDPLQHRAELDRRRHELDDAVKGAVLLAQAVLLGDSGCHMCEVHMLPAAYRSWQPLPRHPPRRIYLQQMTAPPQNADDVRRIVKDAGIEFLFAQFVDMHGKPSAKLVPAHHLDDLLDDGAGFAGFAAGDIGQGPHDPDIIAMPDPTQLHDPALAQERGAASPAT